MLNLLHGNLTDFLFYFICFFICLFVASIFLVTFIVLGALQYLEHLQQHLQSIESCHSSLRKSEEIHCVKLVRKLGTTIHKNKSLQSLTFFNSKRAGCSTPLRLRKKSPLESPLFA